MLGAFENAFTHADIYHSVEKSRLPLRPRRLRLRVPFLLLLEAPPFDYFKIDGDFIRGFGANPTDQLVVEAIVGIARGMGKKTVAEFVTDQAMTDRLRRSGIDYAQGFHVGVPRSIVETFAPRLSATT